MVRFDILRRVLCLALLAATPNFAADPPPAFTDFGVVRGPNQAQRLIPGAPGMTVYGQHLGPPQGCTGAADPSRHETPSPRNIDPDLIDTSVYPTQLCGVQVFVGEKAAGLLYVSDKQINFKIPQDAPESGKAALRVVYNGQSSASQMMDAGFAPLATFELEQPAYVGMPVWIKIHDPRTPTSEFRYPFFLGPAGYGCNAVEVRRNGKLLTQLPGSRWPMYGSGPGSGPCAGYGITQRSRHTGRLPLHLMYGFDEPGIYEIRLTMGREGRTAVPPSQMRVRSEWTPIEILPAKPGLRAAALKELRDHPPADGVDVLTDALPNLLGFPDQASLEILTGYLYHPDAAVRRYAMYGLTYWPTDAVTGLLFDLLRRKGPSDMIIEYLNRPSVIRTARASEIADAVIPFFATDSPAVAEGIIAAVRPRAAQDPALMQALIPAAEHLMPLMQPQPQFELAQMLADTKDPRAHAALLRLFMGSFAQTTARALASFRDPTDLPLFGQTLIQLEQSPRSDWRADLPGTIYQAWGSAAAPYLEEALRGNPDRFMARELAGALMLAGSTEGFQFALRALEGNRAPANEMRSAIRSRFPDMKNAADDAVLAFIRQHASQP
jgi:hypothetical protein